MRFVKISQSMKQLDSFFCLRIRQHSRAFGCFFFFFFRVEFFEQKSTGTTCSAPSSKIPLKMAILILVVVADLIS